MAAATYRATVDGGVHHDQRGGRGGLHRSRTAQNGATIGPRCSIRAERRRDWWGCRFPHADRAHGSMRPCQPALGDVRDRRRDRQGARGGARGVAQGATESRRSCCGVVFRRGLSDALTSSEAIDGDRRRGGARGTYVMAHATRTRASSAASRPVSALSSTVTDHRGDSGEDGEEWSISRSDLDPLVQRLETRPRTTCPWRSSTPQANHRPRHRSTPGETAPCANRVSTDLWGPT